MSSRTRAKTSRTIATLNEGFINESGASSVRVASALLFHVDSRGSLLAVTTHKLVNASSAPALGPGTILSPEHERAILEMLTAPDAQQPFALLPENILHTDRSSTLWWVPSAVRTMHVKTMAGYRALEVRWPTLVLQAVNRTLRVAALAEDRRPSIDTPLFHAPLANVFANTTVCTGNATLPQACQPADVAAWEEVLFGTAFTHTNHSNTVRIEGRSGVDTEALVEFYASREAGQGAFPTDALVPLTATLGTWATSASQGGAL